MTWQEGIGAPLIYRSGLDDRVWVPTIPGYSIAESECMSSTSLRRVKEYVEQLVGEGKWKKLDGGSWEYHESEAGS